MHPRPLRSLVALLAGGVVVLSVVVVAFADTGPHGPATQTGTGGAAATVDALATQAAIDTLKGGGNAVDAAVTAAGGGAGRRRWRGPPGGWCARRPRAVLVRDRRRRLHGHLPRERRKGDDDRR